MNVWKTFGFTYDSTEQYQQKVDVWKDADQLNCPDDTYASYVSGGSGM